MSTPQVPMPEPDYAKSKSGAGARDYLVRNFGKATVEAAERSVVIDVLLMMGVIRPQELISLIEKKCREADEYRRVQALGPNG